MYTFSYFNPKSNVSNLHIRPACFNTFRQKEQIHWDRIESLLILGHREREKNEVIKRTTWTWVLHYFF